MMTEVTAGTQVRDLFPKYAGESHTRL
jgi:hypothetical protein